MLHPGCATFGRIVDSCRPQRHPARCRRTRCITAALVRVFFDPRPLHVGKPPSRTGSRSDPWIVFDEVHDSDGPPTRVGARLSIPQGRRGFVASRPMTEEKITLLIHGYRGARGLKRWGFIEEGVSSTIGRQTPRPLPRAKSPGASPLGWRHRQGKRPPRRRESARGRSSWPIKNVAHRRNKWNTNRHDRRMRMRPLVHDNQREVGPAQVDGTEL